MQLPAVFLSLIHHGEGASVESGDTTVVTQYLHGWARHRRDVHAEHTPRKEALSERVAAANALSRQAANLR
ncbi:hypothetical protein ACFP1Z_11145 [Streptomyces gamaensis]|uniref:Uncharacterized protein n=1 Tax=Streptomyces gamaensis TaxID=1763542 RepID=A0ABW0YVV5_9ACTN